MATRRRARPKRTSRPASRRAAAPRRNPELRAVRAHGWQIAQWNPVRRAYDKNYGKAAGKVFRTPMAAWTYGLDKLDLWTVTALSDPNSGITDPADTFETWNVNAPHVHVSHNRSGRRSPYPRRNPGLKATVQSVGSTLTRAGEVRSKETQFARGLYEYTTGFAAMRTREPGMILVMHTLDGQRRAAKQFDALTNTAIGRYAAILAPSFSVRIVPTPIGDTLEVRDRPGATGRTIIPQRPLTAPPLRGAAIRPSRAEVGKALRAAGFAEVRYVRGYDPSGNAREFSTKVTSDGIVLVDCMLGRGVANRTEAKTEGCEEYAAVLNKRWHATVHRLKYSAYVTVRLKPSGARHNPSRMAPAQRRKPARRRR